MILKHIIPRGSPSEVNISIIEVNISIIEFLHSCLGSRGPAWSHIVRYLYGK